MKTLSLLLSLLLGAAVLLIFVQPWDALEKLLVPDLTVRVLDDRGIVVAGAEFEVTYRREGHLGMLVATDALRERLTASKARFLAVAWKAAYKKARTLGWLSS